MEMLLVLAVIAMLVLVIFPALHSPHVSAIRNVCLGNVKRLTLGTISYAMDNHVQLPPCPPGTNRLPLEIPWAPFEEIQRGGVTRDSMYEPGFPMQNDDRLWNAKSNEYRVIGYALALGGTSSTVVPASQNGSLAPTDRLSQAGKAVYDPAQRVLTADVVISLPGQTNSKLRDTYRWEGIPGGLPDGTYIPHYGLWRGFTTSHFHSPLPTGGNVGMLDGHAVWRQFNEMLPRSTDASGSPIFCW